MSDATMGQASDRAAVLAAIEQAQKLAGKSCFWHCDRDAGQCLSAT